MIKLHYTIFATEIMRCDYFKSTLSNSILIVNFAPMGEIGRKLRDAYTGNQGDYFISLGCDIISLQGTNNESYEDLTELQIKQIKSLINLIHKDYTKIIGYGSSMGGFAAIYFSALYNFDFVLAYSPYFSLKFDWDPRWSGLQLSTNKFLMGKNCISDSCHYFIYYDPCDLDNMHMNHFKEIIPTNKLVTIRIRYAGHPCIYVLHEASLIKDIINKLLFHNNVLDERIINKAKKSSSTYYYLLAQACREHGKERWSNDLIQKIKNKIQGVSLHSTYAFRHLINKQKHNDLIIHESFLETLEKDQTIESQELFDEDFYLQKHPDVSQAIKNGAFESGWHHYELYGKSEFRTVRKK